MYIELSNYYFEKCAKFAEEVLESNKDLYSYRGEKNIHKMKEDNIYGKLGEVAAYKYMKKRGFDVNKPDFEIYERINKSFAADLVTSCGKNIHVKSQGFKSMMRYGASWLLQKSDKIVKNPTENDYILMVCIEGGKANILGVVKALDLVDNKLLEEPRVSRYAHTKKALYFNSIKQSGISMEAI